MVAPMGVTCMNMLVRERVSMLMQVVPWAWSENLWLCAAL
jgi:hypothetical protein